MSNLKATLTLGSVRYSGKKTDKDLNSDVLMADQESKIDEFKSVTVETDFANKAAQNKSALDQLKADVNSFNRSNELKSAVRHGDETIAELNDLVDHAKKVISTPGFVEDAKKGYDLVEYDHLSDRLNHDFDNIHQKINDSSLMPYEGTNITAENSVYGLQKDTKVHGRTLQNLFNEKGPLLDLLLSSEFVPSHTKVDKGDYWEYTMHSINWEVGTRQLLADWSVETKLKFSLKPNTQYTLINPYPIKPGQWYIAHTNGQTFTNNGSDPGRLLITTQSSFTILYYYVNFEVQDGDTVINFPKKIMILEGDYTNTPIEELPFVEGIQGVGEPYYDDYKVNVNAKSVNLLNPNNIRSTEVTINGVTFTPLGDGTYLVNGTSTDRVQFPITRLNDVGNYPKVTDLPIKGGHMYYLNGDFSSSTDYHMQLVSARTDITNVQWSVPSGYIGNVKKEIIDDSVALPIFNVRYSGTTFNNFILKPILTMDYEPEFYIPYKETSQDFFLDEPLMRLPNGVCDTIEGNKVIRRVGKVVLDGNIGYHGYSNETDGTIAFHTDKFETGLNMKAPISNTNSISNQMLVGDVVSGEVEKYNSYSTDYLYIRINKSKLSSYDNVGVKAYFTTNPMDIYYELETPIEEPLPDNLELWSYDDVTHVTSDNYLPPKIETKIPSNVNAMVSTMMNRTRSLGDEMESGELDNLESALEQEVRITMLEMGVR